MTSDPCFGSLSEARRSLVECLSRLGYGAVQHLRIVGGEPVPGPDTRFIVEVKLGSRKNQATNPRCMDFALRSQVLELCSLFDALGDGLIDVIEVRDGLPFIARVSQGHDQLFPSEVRP